MSSQALFEPAFTQEGGYHHTEVHPLFASI
jgi:hypothetical protein